MWNSLPSRIRTHEDVSAATGPRPSSHREQIVDDDELLRVSPAAAATLVRQLGVSILHAVRRVFGANHPELEDIAQDATIAVLRALPRFRGESSMDRFAYRVALLTALSERRRRRARDVLAPTDSRSVDELSRSSAEDPHVESLRQQRREVILQLLDELSEPLAQALALHYLLGYTVEEIAASLSLSPHTVWSRLRLGKNALRRKLERRSRLLETVRSPD